MQLYTHTHTHNISKVGYISTLLHDELSDSIPVNIFDAKQVNTKSAIVFCLEANQIMLANLTQMGETARASAASAQKKKTRFPS